MAAVGNQSTGDQGMNWSQYKILADTPGVWSRWMLEQTLELLQDSRLAGDSNSGSSVVYQRLVLRLNTCMAQAPIPKPADYKGGASLDMFRLTMGSCETRALLALVQRATDMGLRTSGTAKRGLGGFVAAWQEYLGSIDLQS